MATDGKLLCVWIEREEEGDWVTGCRYLVEKPRIDRESPTIEEKAEALGGVILCAKCGRVAIGPFSSCKGSLLEALGLESPSRRT